jgi:UDP-2,3-diacylglucosamine hydrolase
MSTNSLTILADPPPPGSPVGLIAGGGRLPVITAEGLRSQGYKVHALGLADQYDPSLPPLCDTFDQVGLLRVGSWGRALRRYGVHHAVMVGRVDKAKVMFDPLKFIRHLPDLTTLVGYYKLTGKDRRSHALLGFVARQLELAGVALMDSTAPIKSELASAGVMTSRQPTADERADFEFAWPLLSELLRLDIGQAVAIKNRDVIAVEGIEGTDRMIERSGALCKRGGWTLCKGIRAGHDRRSDVPTVGLTTIENLASYGGTCLALAADNVIMIDKVRMLDLADQLGVSIIGVPLAQTPSFAAGPTSLVGGPGQFNKQTDAQPEGLPVNRVLPNSQL